MGNGRCDDTFNTEQCLYDFGDCCLPQGNKITFIKYMSLTFDRISSIFDNRPDRLIVRFTAK